MSRKILFFELIILVFGTWLVINELDRYIILKPYIRENLMPKSLVDVIDKITADEAIIALKDKRYGHTCSEEASLLGPHQKVISYSFFLAPRYYEGYWIGINPTLRTLPLLYPGWQVRIYGRTKDLKFLNSVLEDFPFLFYCDITKLPPPLPNLENYIPTIVRYAPLSDPQVDVVIFRDTDSKILQREVDAVDEWLYKSNKTLHIMRDNEAHLLAMLGGMWGIKQTRENQLKLQTMRDKLFSITSVYVRTDVDQPALERVVYDAFKDDYIAHDSYLCEIYPGTIPWPSRRNAKLEFVGAQFYKSNNTFVKPECPLACRPKNHTDWNYC